MQVNCKNNHTFNTNAKPGSVVTCRACWASTGKRVAVYVKKADAVDEHQADEPAADSAGMAKLRAEVDELRARLDRLSREVGEHDHGPAGDSDDYRRAILGRWLHQLQHAFSAGGIVIPGGGVAVKDAADALGITEANAGQRLREATKLGLMERSKSGRANVYVFTETQDHLYHAAEPIPGDVEYTQET